MKDVVLVPAKRRAEVEFTANNPGRRCFIVISRTIWTGVHDGVSVCVDRFGGQTGFVAGAGCVW